ncbi:glycoside hydrolase family 3 N-terminal domain-containing protein [Haloferula sp. A504]|uniref:glycoside hydrolase family 3 N-terminal domain-containing protein n=1 Tax=Haloferula sp. A504 TaxID=3373601 RepID=UPI0031BE0B27|nr:glycosyl hydrolase [Verrucomicrobiaceae bacterium E54]
MSQPNQLLLIGIPGTELDPATATRLKKLQPGGYILFGRNIESAVQLRKLVDDLRDLSPVEPVVTIDQEGGRVSRLRLIGHEPPSAQQLRDRDEPELIRRHGNLTGRLLRLFGFNLDLCPVLDISFDDEADNSLKGRCWGSSVGETIDKAELFRAAMAEHGILSCGKHFPGYTFAGLDPHHDLPRIDRSRAELDATELAVFRHFADKVDSMMIGHAHYPCFDAEKNPASLSTAVIRDCLRGDLGFGGLVMTDDLDMGAILNTFSWEETIRRAVRAGNDFVMICHRLEAAEDALRTLESTRAAELDPALENLDRFKQRLAPPDDFTLAAHQALDLEVRQLRIDTLGEAAADEQSPENAARSPVEDY